MRFIWLDDNPDRRDAANNMAGTLDVAVDFIDLSTAESSDTLAKLPEGTEPDLVIIDHNLTKNTSSYYKKGSTLATFIREKWLDCPIISVSAKVEDIDSQQRSLYIDVFPADDIAKYYPNIVAIADGFVQLKKERPANLTAFMKLLGTPKDDLINMENVVPMVIKNNFKGPSLLVEIALWIKHTLIKRPGFLYDNIRVATLIGVKEDSFQKVEELFKPAIYNGPFANENEIRWWKNIVLEIIYSKIEEGVYPWHKGHKLPTMTKDDISICHYSQEPFPDVVAFKDETADAKEYAMHRKYTRLHPEYETMLNFDDIRVMGPEQ